MIVPRLRMLATTLAGIGFGFAVGFGIAFAHAETRVIDGMPRRVVRFEANTPDMKEFLFEFPADFVPHRVVENTRYGGLLRESDAFDFEWRLGLLYALEGAVVGVALGFGAEASKVVATGVIATLLFSVFLLPAFSLPFVNSPTQQLPLVIGIVFLGLMAAGGEAVYSATARARNRRRSDR